jgi:hypothetical protein
MTHARAWPIKAAPHLTDTYDADPNVPQGSGPGIRKCQEPVPTPAGNPNPAIAPSSRLGPCWYKFVCGRNSLGFQ